MLYVILSDFYTSLFKIQILRIFLEKISVKLKKNTKLKPIFFKDCATQILQIWSTFFFTCETIHLFETFLCFVLSSENLVSGFETQWEGENIFFRKGTS